MRRRESARPGTQGSENHRARLGLAAMRQRQWRFQDSIRVLSEGVAENPLAPGWVMPTLLLRRGNNRALIVDPARSRDAHRMRADVRWRDFHKSAEEQLAWIERRQGPEKDPLYAALVPGNRLVAKRRWDEATAAYERVCQQYPSDLQVRYRLAYPRFMQGGPAASMAEFSVLSLAEVRQCGYGRSRCCI